LRAVAELQDTRSVALVVMVDLADITELLEKVERTLVME
jgi:hypothetical protein